MKWKKAWSEGMSYKFAHDAQLASGTFIDSLSEAQRKFAHSLIGVARAENYSELILELGPSKKTPAADEHE